MCYAIPGKILSIEKGNALIDFGGVQKRANMSFVKCRPGDFVLVHAGFAIQKVDPDIAAKSWETVAGLKDD
jgi:hydrogenase expression/formation protein HypC